MEDNNDTPLEVLPPSAIMAMEKAQLDMQICTAHQYPRSLELFKKRALSMACLDPETADSCIYVRPVGKENGKQKFAEGPSIRLAEIVAVSYGNLRAASKVVEQTERYVKCTGMAHDLESNTAMSADCIESTVTKDGKPYSERQRALVAKVCGAKAIRDAIFKCVPRALCKPIMDAAKKVASGKDRPLEERRKKAQAWISTLRIDDSRVFASIGVSGWSDVTDDHLTILTGLRTAMADGDETIDSAFPPIDKDQQAQGKNAPAQTAHQKATQAATPATAQQTKEQLKEQPGKKADKEPEDDVPFDNATPLARATQEPSKPVEAVQTPSEPEKPQEQQTQQQNEAPGQATTTEQTPSAAPSTPVTPSDDPRLQPETGDTDNILSIKTHVRNAGGTFNQLRTYLLSKKLMREEQKDLRELASSRLDAINRHVGTSWMKDILAQP